MFALSGTGIGRRIAIGKAIVLDRSHQEIPKYEVLKDQVQSEIERFQSALARTRAELRRIQEEIPDHAPQETNAFIDVHLLMLCLLYTSPSPRDKRQSRMPSSA